MTNETLLQIMKRCKIKNGIELVPGEAYLFHQNFFIPIDDDVERVKEEIEIIILTHKGKKVGCIYRMEWYDIHVLIKEKYRGRHFMSNFLKKGIIEEIWKENKSTDLCDVDSWETFNKKKYLANLCHMTIRNEKEIIRDLKNKYY